MFKEKLAEALEAIWSMCRKNELYTLEMFKQDMTDKTLSLIADEINGLEKKHQDWCREFMKKGYCNCMSPEFNQELKELKTKLGITEKGGE